MSKALNIQIRGDWYKVNEKGQIFAGPYGVDPSDGWKFLGVSTHHMQRRYAHSFKDIWENPILAINGLFWDLDHGTTRMWAGSYAGKVPRIRSCDMVEV